MKNMFQKLLDSYKKIQTGATPQINLVWGFFTYVLFGWILLSLPFSQTVDVSFLDSLFIATSAVSTTGLVTVSVSDSFTLFGEIVVMALFQVGGIGYMTLTTYYLLFTTSRITQWHQKIITAEFTMPETLKIKDFIKSVIIFTIIMESLGAISFFLVFKNEGMATGSAIWYGIFHSVSAFCTAGFGLFNDSFISYQDNGWVNAIISVLAICGSLGFIVVTDIWCKITKKGHALSFTTQIIFYGFLILLTAGTVINALSENPAITGESIWMKSFFQTMTAMTTVGFNTVDTGALSLSTLLFVVFLMYIGASPSGTAGGMKITTLTAMLSIMLSRLSGNKRVIFLKRTIPYDRLYVATSTFMMYTIIVFFGAFLLSYSEDFQFRKILFEVASALGTVGLSTGITGSLTVMGKVVIIILMFIGRVGVITFGFALLAQKRKKMQEECLDDDLAV